MTEEQGGSAATGTAAPRKTRVDAQRNTEALLKAAKAAFAVSGVDVPMREIAARAGVGVGTVYRHFPKRSDLVQAVFRREVDACADAATAIAAEHDPGEALTRWLLRFTDFLATKQGLAAALHSGDPAFNALPAYFSTRLGPTVQALLDDAAASGEIRPAMDAEELLSAVSRLCTPDPGGDRDDQSRRLVSLLVDGMRYGANARR